MAPSLLLLPLCPHRGLAQKCHRLDATHQELLFDHFQVLKKTAELNYFMCTCCQKPLELASKESQSKKKQKVKWGMGVKRS
jgi:hypothetical protein